jgi:hypothetical protein
MENSEKETFSIFIFKSQVNSLNQAEQFLRNRNWIVTSSTNLREALAYIIQKQPQFVLVTSDHPNKKVRLLPKMLIQAFPVRVIGFAEKGSGLSMQALNEMGLEYNLQPPVSGPAIERMIAKIRKDDERKASELKSSTSIDSSQNGDTPISQMMTFKGASLSAEEVQASFAKARSALSHLIPVDSASTQHQVSTQETVGQLLNTTTGRPAQDFGGFEQSQKSPESGEPFQFKDGPSEWDQPSLKPPIRPETDSGSADSLSPQSSLADSAQKNNGDATGENAASSGTTSSGESTASKAKPSAPLMESEYHRKQKSGYQISTSDSEVLPSSPSESVIQRAAEKALTETVQISGTEKMQLLSEASNLSCLMIQSPKFAGYLVCAMGSNRTIEKDFIHLIKTRLFSFLRANGEPIKDGESLDLEIHPVDFTDWSLKEAQFLKKSLHQGEEIAMAFFPAPNVEINLQQSVSSKMLKVELAHLKDDVPLEFDLYLYMPANNKYLLYTPKGRPLYGKQRGRLAQSGITHMHLKKENASQVTKYQAQNYLNEKVATYKKMKSSA